MKTKLSASLVCLLVAVLCLFGMTACGDGADCKHSFGEWNVVKAASCTEDGSQERVCSLCGEKETQSIEMLGHDFADATCVAPKTCKVCLATEGEASGHDFADATCVAPKTCKICSATEGELGAHDFADATCVAPKTCKVCSATEGEPSDKHTPVSFEIDLAAYNVCGGKDAGKIKGEKCSGCGIVIGIPMLPVTDFCTIEPSEPEITTDENGHMHVSIKLSCTECDLKGHLTMWTDGTLLCGGEATYQNSKMLIGDEVILDFSFAEALDGDHNYETTYNKVGESCEDGVQVVSVCTKCGSAFSYAEEGHFTVSDEKITRKEIEEGCNAAILEYHCEVCDEIYETELESDCRFSSLPSLLPLPVIQKSCSECGSTLKETKEYGERDENCKCLVTITKIYSQNGKEYYTETDTYTEEDHDMQEVYEMLGKSCEDGVKLSKICKNCGYSDEFWRDTVYYHDYVITHEKAGDVCEDGIWEIFSCNRCDNENRVLYDSHFGDVVEEVPVNGGCNSFYVKFVCFGCGETMDDSMLRTDCDFQFVTEHENGDWLYRCTVCGAELLDKLVSMEEAEDGLVTITGSYIYSQNGEVYYVEKYSISDYPG